MTQKQWFGVLILIAILVVFAMQIPIYAEKCVKNLVSDQYECFRSHLLLVTAWQLGNFFETWASAITAFASLVIGFFTFTLWRATSGMLASSTDQSRSMERSIGEAARSAAAMERIANAMSLNVVQVVESVETSKEVAAQQKLFGKMQMRAYISVLIGTAIFQDRQQKLRFAAHPLILNTGHTPAYSVRWRIAADILPVPLPDNFGFPLPNSRVGSSLLGPHQSATMMAVVPNLVADDLVTKIKRNDGEALYVWGTLQYKDIFGRLHRSTFAQQLYWLQIGPEAPNGDIPERIEGWYLHKHNRAN